VNQVLVQEGLLYCCIFKRLRYTGGSCGREYRHFFLTPVRPSYRPSCRAGDWLSQMQKCEPGPSDQIKNTGHFSTKLLLVLTNVLLKIVRET
jgi:hypothetical protein